MEDIVTYLRPTSLKGLKLKKVIQYHPTLLVDYYYKWNSPHWVCCNNETYLGMCFIDGKYQVGLANTFFDQLNLIYLKMKIPYTLNYTDRKTFTASVETFKTITK